MVPMATPTPTPPATPLDTTETPTPTPVETIVATTLTAIVTPTVTSTPIDVARFIGVYDDSAGVPETQFGVPAIATLTGTGALTFAIFFDGHTSLGLNATARPDGTVALSGQGVVEDDEVILLDGNSTLSETRGVQRIVGKLHDRTLLGFSPSFAFERLVNGSAARFAGSYGFRFTPSPSGCDCATTTTLEIEVGADGFGRSIAMAEERDAGGAVLGHFDAGECLVTFTGTIRCQLAYQTTVPTPPSGIPGGPSFLVTLTGRLVAHAGGATGSGRTEAPIFPEAFFLGGDWTAEPAAP